MSAFEELRKFRARRPGRMVEFDAVDGAPKIRAIAVATDLKANHARTKRLK
jgi:hypothetical protein